MKGYWSADDTNLSQRPNFWSLASRRPTKVLSSATLVGFWNRAFSRCRLDLITRRRIYMDRWLILFIFIGSWKGPLSHTILINTVQVWNKPTGILHSFIIPHINNVPSLIRPPISKLSIRLTTSGSLEGRGPFDKIPRCQPVTSNTLYCRLSEY